MTVDITISGGDAIPGIDLFLVVSAASDPDHGTSTDEGPIVTAIDLTGPGTIFHSNNTGQHDLGFPNTTPSYQPTATTTASGTVAADGVLAHVTIETGSPTRGLYYFSLTSDILGPTDVAVDPGNDVILQDGFIGFPEPGSFVFGATGLVAVSAVAIQKRARRRSRVN